MWCLGYLLEKRQQGVAAGGWPELLGILGACRAILKGVLRSLGLPHKAAEQHSTLNSSATRGAVLLGEWLLWWVAHYSIGLAEWTSGHVSLMGSVLGLTEE